MRSPLTERAHSSDGPSGDEQYAIAVITVEETAFPEIRRSLGPAFRTVLAATETQIKELMDYAELRAILFDLDSIGVGASDGIDVLKEMRKLREDLVFVAMTRSNDRNISIKASRAGADEFFQAPLNFPELQIVLSRAIQKRAMEIEGRRMVEQVENKSAFCGMIGGSSAMQKVYQAVLSVADTASTALHNASLLLAERKVEILETLVTVSQQITSTLNLERMLQTIVDAPQAVIPYERAAIVLASRGRLKLSAVTGQTQLNIDAADIAPLNSVLQWAALSEEIINVRQHDDVIDAPREETRAKFEKYFAESGVRGFYAMPLGDDTGRVGMYALESSDPDFLSSAHIEILQVLAGQATVALRNAQMYKEVPFISVLEPVLERKRKFMAMEKKRRAMIVGLVSAAIIFLAIVPLPLRVNGDAVVAPVHRAQVQPEIEGAVSYTHLDVYKRQVQ